MQIQVNPQAPETIKIKQAKISCNGGGPLGHPTVYLTVNKDTHQVECPYCDRLFVLDNK